MHPLPRVLLRVVRLRRIDAVHAKRALQCSPWGELVAFRRVHDALPLRLQMTEVIAGHTVTRTLDLPR